MRVFITIFLLIISVNCVYSLPELVNLKDPIDTLDYYRYTDSTDSWWWNSSGKWIWENGLNTRIDAYSYRNPGIPIQVFSMKYDENNRLIEAKVEELEDNNTLKAINITWTTYDLKGRILSAVIIEGDTNNKAMFTYDYGDQDSARYIHYLKWDTTQTKWDTLTVAANEYNAKNLVTKSTTQTYDSNGLMQDYPLTIVEYDYTESDSIKLTVQTAYLNDETSSIEASYFFYNGKGLKNKELNLYTNPDGETDTSLVTTYSYYDNNLIKSMMESSYGGSDISLREFEYPDSYTRIIMDSRINVGDETEPNDTTKYTRTIVHYIKPLSVNEMPVNENKLQIYPNPVSKDGIINFDLGTSGYKDLSVSITDFSGAIVSCLNIENAMEQIEIPCPNASAGVYFIKISSEGKVIKFGKFVIE